MAVSNNTIFDDVFRTMIEKMPELVIPLINEVFGTNYPADIPIIQQRNEHQTEEGILKGYADIEEYLEEELLDQDREQAYRDMIELIRRIADYIFADRKKVKERLGDIMGGKVLELESDKLIKLGRAEGRAEAQQQAIRNLVTSMNLTVKQAMDALGIPEDERNKYIDGLKQK